MWVKEGAISFIYRTGVKMEKIYTLEEYEATGNMILIQGEFYHEIREFADITAEKLTLEELEHYKFPEIHTTQRERIGLDTEDIITILEEHDASYDGYEVGDTAKDFIKEFVDAFNEKYADYSYSAYNTDEAIILSKSEEQKIKEYMRKLICECERDCK